MWYDGVSLSQAANDGLYAKKDRRSSILLQGPSSERSEQFLHQSSHSTLGLTPRAARRCAARLSSAFRFQLHTGHVSRASGDLVPTEDNG
jgi:hypothetical protein